LGNGSNQGSHFQILAAASVAALTELGSFWALNTYSAAFAKTFFGSFGTVLAGISSGETAALYRLILAKMKSRVSMKVRQSRSA